MKSDKIDWNKTIKGSDLGVLSALYSFISVNNFIEKGNNIKQLRLKFKGEYKVSEIGFREFLNMILSIKWDEKKLTTKEINTLNMIYKYLKTPILKSI